MVTGSEVDEGAFMLALPEPGDAADLIARWPRDLPLLALVSGDPSDRRRSRWTILATPADDPIDLAEAPDAGAALLDAEPRMTAAPPLPFAGGWIGWLGYDLGTDFEPTARCAAKPRRPGAGRGWLARCDAALVRNEETGEWRCAGVDERAARSLLHRIRESPPAEPPLCRVGEFRGLAGREAYEAAVVRTIEHIRAGDIFQANIAHELRAPFQGSPRAAFLRMLRSARPAFGAYLEPPQSVRDRRILCSISPELFLDADFRTRAVETRPIKGTRRGGDSALAHELRESEKDRAELAMIVDLMRNDLSRVCEVGSVRVETPRAIEEHGGGGVLHAVATVRGAMREGVRFADLVRATFPPGSVTGAPKIRAMQIIDELEPFSRGAYCGAIGFIADSGPVRLSVAIRTATINPERAELVYPVGAGIVADSDPAREWEETLDKAEAIRRAFRIGAEP